VEFFHGGLWIFRKSDETLGYRFCSYSAVLRGLEKRCVRELSSSWGFWFSYSYRMR
jgi:hypothetical protein